MPAIFQESEAYYVLGIERGSSGLKEVRVPSKSRSDAREPRVYAQRQYVVPPASPAKRFEPHERPGAPAQPRMPSAGCSRRGPPLA